MEAVRILECIQKIAQAPSVASLMDLLEDALHPVGVRGIGIATFDDEKNASGLNYSSRNLTQANITHATQKSQAGFGSAGRKAPGDDELLAWTDDDEVADLAGKTGPRSKGKASAPATGVHGWSVPVRSAGGLRGWVYYNSETAELSDVNRMTLQLLGVAAQGRMIELKNADQYMHKQNLSKRELEVLRWTAAGKSSQDIGDILMLSSRTVEFHLLNAGRKLDTLNRVHAVVEAMRHKLISL